MNFQIECINITIDIPVAIKAIIASSFGKILATSLKLYITIHNKAVTVYFNIDFI